MCLLHMVKCFLLLVIVKLMLATLLVEQSAQTVNLQFTLKQCKESTIKKFNTFTWVYLHIIQQCHLLSSFY